MDLGKTLQENLRQASALEIIASKAKQRKMPVRMRARTGLKELASVDAVVFPAYDQDKVADLVYRLETEFFLLVQDSSYLEDAFRNIVKGIESLEESQVYLIQSIIMPKNYDSPQRFRKWSGLVPINSFDVETSPFKLTRRAFSSVDLRVVYTGYHFAGSSNGSGSNFKRIMLEDCISAAMIFSYCTAAEKSDDTANITLMQHNQPANSRLLKTGGIYKVKVPSIEKQNGNYYVIQLENVPIRRKNSEWPDFSPWSNLNAIHSCEAVIDSTNTKRYTIGTIDLCKHVLTATLELGWELKKIDSPYELAYLPNVVPTQSQFEFAMKLRNSVLVEEIDGKATIYRPLTKMEREVLQWKRVALRGFQETFNAKRGFQDYIIGKSISS